MSTKNYTFYKFICINDDVKNCYVGSTANMKKRRTDHKSVCHNENSKNYNFKIYQTIRENGGWGNWKIVELGTKDNITKREAEQIEEEYRVQLKADMNVHRAFTTEEQMKEDYKEHRKEYYQDNKEKIAEYYQDNKEKRTKQMKDYYEQNKAKILEQLNEQHNCPCGSRYTHVNKSRHFKTQKHQKYINSQQ
jgi:hypothetical protein